MGTDIGGFAIKGRGDASQRATKLTVFASLNGKTWYAVDFGASFEGNRDQVSMQLNQFSHTVKARFLRFQIVSFHGHLSLRIGVLVPRTLKPAKAIFTNKNTMRIGDLAILDPPTGSRESSGDYDHANCRHGMLSDSHGWCAAQSKNGHWYVADLGEKVPIQGIATKGRADTGQWVKEHSVFVSNDKDNWYAVDGGKQFTGNRNNKDVKVNRFSEILNARYVKVQISSWKAHMSFRMGVLVAKSLTKGVITNNRQKLGDLVVMDPPENTHSSSPTYPDTSCKHGMLSDSNGWCAANSDNKNGAWKQIDMARATDIGGFAIKGRGDASQRATKLTVFASLNGKTWYAVDFGASFEGNRDQVSMQLNQFSHTVKARFLRFQIVSFHGHLSLRIGVLVPRTLKPAKAIFTNKNTMRIGDLAILDPPTGSRESSGDYDHANCRHGMLSDSHGWCAAQSKNGHWYVADLGAKVPIQGIATKGRADTGQWVKEYSVFVSNDKDNWYAVDGGKQFTGNRNNKDVKVNRFSEILNARYVKVQISSWKAHMSFRMGVLVAKSLTKIFSGKRVDKYNVKDLPSSSRRASSQYNHRNCRQGELASSAGWCAGVSQNGQWYQMDMGKVRPIAGVRMKGRADANQWVKAFQAFVSVDDKTWYAVDEGKEYHGNSDKNTPRDALFSNILHARYLRLQFTSYHGHLSMRVAPLIAK